MSGAAAFYDPDALTAMRVASRPVDAVYYSHGQPSMFCVGMPWSLN